MAVATLRCYAELNDFLTPARRQREFAVAFDPPTPAGHLIQQCGVPCCAVELIIRDGVSIDFATRVCDGDRLAVYPMFEAFDVGPALRVRRAPLREIRFSADAHLGRLARALRMLGFDTFWANDIGDAALAARAVAERRILLTRDRQLLLRRDLTHACHVPSGKTGEQLAYLVKRLQLCSRIRPFRRCLVCNAQVCSLPAAVARTRVPPAVARTAAEFWHCTGCNKVYWRGSHWQAMWERIRALCPDVG
jgi:uncharacterized protein with PIN domain